MLYATRVLGPVLYLRPVKEFLKWVIGKTIPPGPSKERNQKGFSLIIGEVTNDRQAIRAKLRTPEAYHLTALTSVEIMKHILSSDYQAGFQTPSRVYGPDFILQFPGVEREDL
jgi:short subunit dehydrogenase-like uncharacterized protein